MVGRENYSLLLFECRLENIEIPLSKRHKLVGAGGHRIRHLIEETGIVLS